MKKRFCLIFGLFFILLCFVGCGSTTNVSEENVKELFLSSLKAICYAHGSDFYEIEKDANNNPVKYENIDDNGTIYYKTSNLTKEQLISEIEKYTTLTSEQKEQIENLTVEKNGDLYIDVLASYGGYESIFDINSISLTKHENDTYYISVDEYAYPDAAGDPNMADGNPHYVHTVTFQTAEENNILKIEKFETNKDTQKNSLEKCEFIGSFDKFWGDVLRRSGNIPD